MNGDKAFLHRIWNVYKRAPTGSFYDSYLKILFFNVLNNPVGQEKGPFAGIKYLNGGLFRKIPEEERYPNYTIQDDILTKIIDFLEVYRFEEEQEGVSSEELKRTMSPEILGYIFERTANHEKGAYYTPANVTEYITSGTAKLYILDKVNRLLEKKGSPPVKSIENALLDGSLEKQDVMQLYAEVSSLKILDPACGSGAFFMPIIGYLMKTRRILSNELGMPFSDYKMKKEIIEQNIFGVDLNPQAIEIAKLRLWLELVSTTNNIDEVELLPNIEYNIVAGNSLLGLSQTFRGKGLQGFMPLNLSKQIEMLKPIYPDHAERIRELSETPDLDNILRIRDLLVKLYKSEQDPKNAYKIKNVIENVHSSLHQQMNEHFLAFINQQLSTKNQIGLSDLTKHHSFHWIMEFHDVLSNGGFDVVLGNPPYIELREVDYSTAHYSVDSCGNLYAHFFEKAVELTNDDGYFGYIVPISAICTDRMAPLQQMLIDKSAIFKTSNFDDRPDKIFKGLEHCRSSIIFCKKGKNDKKIYSTRYHRWHAVNRDKLFKKITYFNISKLVKPGIIPKISSQTEVDIIKKINSNALLKDIIVNSSDTKIIYHNAPQYWIRAMNFMPEFSSDRGISISSHNKEFFIKDILDCKNEIIAIINSSLFYWYFIINSNCRDLTMREIKDFPFEVGRMNASLRSKLKDISIELMNDYMKKSKLKENIRKTTGKVVYREFYPKESKNIIDKIDDVLALHYGFTDAEIEFIRNFDLMFRMGGE